MITPFRDKLICEKIEERLMSKYLIIPDIRKEKSAVLMRVLLIGENVKEKGINKGDVVVVHPEWYGATIRVEDDETGEVFEYDVLHEDYVMAIQHESV